MRTALLESQLLFQLVALKSSHPSCPFQTRRWYMRRSQLNNIFDSGGIGSLAEVRPGKTLSMTKVFCGIVALTLIACVAANAGEPPTFEVRKRDAVGELKVVQVP